VSLVSQAGYFRQEIDSKGRQVEKPDWWDPARWCAPLDAIVAVEIEGKPVWIRPWLYVHTSTSGYRTPILLLDANVELNSTENRTLTRHLYGGNEVYRLKQEIILGIGGVRILQALGFEIDVYHLNEGHAALLTLELLNRRPISPAAQHGNKLPYDVSAVREHCVFTTHTPVEAGHDRFSYQLFERLLPDFVDATALKLLAGEDQLNMTRLALNLCGYVNGVARRHAETTRRMFPGYRIDAITNGVHAGTWTHEGFAELYDRHVPQWQHEPELLVRALQISEDEIWRCHRSAKRDLVRHVKKRTRVELDKDALTIGFARRMTGYKRPLLLFQDLDRLTELASQHPFQIVLAGKAHPRDHEGKEAIRQIHQIVHRLRGKITCVFLPNYDMQVAKTLATGVDVWLNTPSPPLEASGTSGMKAALNGVLNLSTLDGWWIEGCIDGVTGWPIGGERDNVADHSAAVYEKLEEDVLPLFFNDPERWRWMMKQAIGNIAYYFNSHRMMRRYATEAYLRPKREGAVALEDVVAETEHVGVPRKRKSKRQSRRRRR